MNYLAKLYGDEEYIYDEIIKIQNTNTENIQQFFGGKEKQFNTKDIKAPIIQSDHRKRVFRIIQNTLLYSGYLLLVVEERNTHSQV